MATRICALFMGLVYLFFGICGLIPSLVQVPRYRMRYFDFGLVGGGGDLFGWMPTNLIHDLVYIAIGAAGIIAFLSFTLAILYCRGLLALTVFFIVLGLLPLGISSVWGLLPLYDWNLMLHTVTAILAYYYGWVYPLDLGGPEPVEAAPDVGPGNT